MKLFGRRAKRYESPLDKEECEQREWEQTSDDPVARRHREFSKLSLDDVLLRMAEREEQADRGFCRLSRAESDKAYELFQQGLVREDGHQYRVTLISERGRERVMEIRRERGAPENTLFCADCGHGLFEHRGRAVWFNDVQLDEGDYPANHYHRCKVDGCGCRRFARDYDKNPLERS